jgi:hypothetical protein
MRARLSSSSDTRLPDENRNFGISLKTEKASMKQTLPSMVPNAGCVQMGRCEDLYSDSQPARL